MRDGGSAGNIVSSNKEYSFYPSKETNLYAEGRVNTYVVINIDNSKWSTIEPDTNFKSDLYIMKSDGTKYIPFL